jgi:hypothetical protein
MRRRVRSGSSAVGDPPMWRRASHLRLRGLILITWDEGADPPLQPTHPLALAVGPQVQPGIYNQGPFTHYSMLRTVEDGFRLRHLGAARTAKPTNQIWK